MDITKLPILGILLLLLGTAHADLKNYDHPLVLKPYIIRDGATVTSDKSHWIPLPWKDYVALTRDTLLFKIDGVIYTCPMAGYICLQEDE